MDLQVRVDGLNILDYREQIGRSIVDIEVVERRISGNVIEAVHYRRELLQYWAGAIWTITEDAYRLLRSRMHRVVRADMRVRLHLHHLLLLMVHMDSVS